MRICPGKKNNHADQSANKLNGGSESDWQIIEDPEDIGKSPDIPGDRTERRNEWEKRKGKPV
jgi:hypothetical protein